MLLKNKLILIHLKTDHSYHLVDPSPWPILGSLGGFSLTTGGVLFMHKYYGGWNLFLTGFIIIFYTMYFWWQDIIREATFEDTHTSLVKQNLRLGMILFIISEIMFFVAFFWAFFYSSISPVYNIGAIWPPKYIGLISSYTIPLTNTYFLLSSGVTITWAHHALLIRAKKHTIVALIFTIIFAFLFTILQGFEYLYSPFCMSDGIYGSCFFMATGFHGFHVLIGTIAIIIAFIRIILNHFTNTHHFGFEASIWYWHFVDVVWLFLFINIYWWSNYFMVNFNLSFIIINDFLELLIILIISIIIACLLILFSFIFTIQKFDSEKLSVYECGYEPYENARHTFNIQFYLIAIFFIIFDMEILFILPWVLTVSKSSFLNFWCVVDFIFELSLGFFYIWYKNSLNWK